MHRRLVVMHAQSLWYEGLQDFKIKLYWIKEGRNRVERVQWNTEASLDSTQRALLKNTARLDWQ